jgi:hypothetical protein
VADTGDAPPSAGNSVADFIAAIEDPRRREEAQHLDVLLQQVTGEAPRMWGPSIIGYGRYTYRYASGKEGTMCRLGFSPRKAQIVVYLVPDGSGIDQTGSDALLAALGPHTVGKGCLNIKRLDKVDSAVLGQLLSLNWQLMAQRYPA